MTTACGLRQWFGAAFMGLALLSGVAAAAESLSGDQLVKALRQGGLVIVMRHASSPRAAPDPSTANADNPQAERQLDESGRRSAIEFGQALRRLKIVLAGVYASPTYRARETVRLAQLGEPQLVAELGDRGQSMAALGETEYAWLRNKAAQASPAGANLLLVTHLPNIAGAFPQDSASLADGEALLFAPTGEGGTRLLAHIRIEDWGRLPD